MKTKYADNSGAPSALHFGTPFAMLSTLHHALYYAALFAQPIALPSDEQKAHQNVPVKHPVTLLDNINDLK